MIPGSALRMTQVSRRHHHLLLPFMQQSFLLSPFSQQLLLLQPFLMQSLLIKSLSLQPLLLQPLLIESLLQLLLLQLQLMLLLEFFRCLGVDAVFVPWRDPRLVVVKARSDYSSVFGTTILESDSRQICWLICRSSML